MMTVSHRTVRNGTTPAGEWVVEERNVVEDYRKAYGKMPDSYFIISVGANSQYSGSNSRAEVDFIEFIPVPGEEGAGEKMMRRIAVTGAGGFIGGALALRIDREAGFGAVRIVRDDFSRGLLAGKAGRLRSVVHLAGESGAPIRRRCSGPTWP